MAHNRWERFWEITCTFSTILHFLLVMLISLLLLTLLSIALGIRNAASAVIVQVNLILSFSLLSIILYMIHKCRRVYN